MTYDEKWSYTYGQIEEYLLSCGAEPDSSGSFNAGFVPVHDNDRIGVYCLPECRITLEELPDRPLGLLTFPQTRIIIEGPGADDFYHGFYLNFLSGGG